MSSAALSEADIPDDDEVLTGVHLMDDGIMWMINSTIFHPRGLALCRHSATGELSIKGDGAEVWIFEESTAQAKKDAFEAMIARHLARL